eukprot:scaffold137686_cov16-Tisochrysis_lutea.AAC.1
MPYLPLPHNSEVFDCTRCHGHDWPGLSHQKGPSVHLLGLLPPLVDCPRTSGGCLPLVPCCCLRSASHKKECTKQPLQHGNPFSIFQLAWLRGLECISEVMQA